MDVPNWWEGAWVQTCRMRHLMLFILPSAASVYSSDHKSSRKLGSTFLCCKEARRIMKGMKKDEDYGIPTCSRGNTERSPAHREAGSDPGCVRSGRCSRLEVSSPPECLQRLTYMLNRSLHGAVCSVATPRTGFVCLLSQTGTGAVSLH
jgi:hypothetical protein